MRSYWPTETKGLSGARRATALDVAAACPLACPGLGTIAALDAKGRATHLVRTCLISCNAKRIGAALGAKDIYGSLRRACNPKAFGLSAKTSALLGEDWLVLHHAIVWLQAQYAKATPVQKKNSPVFSDAKPLLDMIPLALPTSLHAHYRLATARKTLGLVGNEPLVVLTTGTVRVARYPTFKATWISRTWTDPGFPGVRTRPGQLHIAFHEIGIEQKHLATTPARVLTDRYLPMVRLAQLLPDLGRVILIVSDKSRARAHRAVIRHWPKGREATSKSIIIDGNKAHVVAADKKTPISFDKGVFRWDTAAETLDTGTSFIYVQVSGEVAQMRHLVALMDRPRKDGGNITIVLRGVANPLDAVKPKLSLTKGVAEIIKLTAKAGDAAALKNRLTAKLPELNRCYTAALPAKPNIKGVLVARIQIDQAGDVVVSRAMGVDRVVSRCVAAQIKKLRFGKQPATGIKAAIQIRFTPQK